MPTIHVVVMGVAGCGKSAVGRLIAQHLALPYVEGDDFHPQGNIARMRQGIALDDADTTPESLALQAAAWLGAGVQRAVRGPDRGLQPFP